MTAAQWSIIVPAPKNPFMFWELKISELSMVPSCFQVTSVQSRNTAETSTSLLSSCSVLFIMDRGISSLNKGKLRA